MTVVPLLAYAMFGLSRILVLGQAPRWPPSSLARPAIALAGMMALVSGAAYVLAGVLRLGFITDLLSKPIRYGYMNGIALSAASRR